MSFENTSRRSFMKKTTALAVGISATTLFSGLAHATGTSASCARKYFIRRILDGAIPNAYPVGQTGPKYSPAEFDLVECFDQNNNSIGHYHTNITLTGSGGHINVNTLPDC
jgi:hypothetical protein